MTGFATEGYAGRESVSQQLHSILASDGFDVSLRSDGTLGKWLLRGTPHFMNEFIPQAGEFGTHGVFFSTNVANTAVLHGGVVYVFSTADVLGKNVPLYFPSQEYTDCINEIMSFHGFNISSIADGCEADRLLYREHPVFSVKKGILTTNYAINTDTASAVYDVSPHAFHRVR